eukprot:1181933-Prorocentrum_minimum.AAC.7
MSVSSPTPHPFSFSRVNFSFSRVNFSFSRVNSSRTPYVRVEPQPSVGRFAAEAFDCILARFFVCG